MRVPNSIVVIAKYEINSQTGDYNLVLANGTVRTLSTYNTYGWIKANGYTILRESSFIVKLSENTDNILA